MLETFRRGRKPRLATNNDSRTCQYDESSECATARQHKSGNLLPNRKDTGVGAPTSLSREVGALHQCSRVNPKTKCESHQCYVDESSMLHTPLGSKCSPLFRLEAALHSGGAGTPWFGLDLAPCLGSHPSSNSPSMRCQRNRSARICSGSIYNISDDVIFKKKG